MKKSLLAFFIVSLSLCGFLEAGSFFSRTRKPGYFFLPSRTLFNFRPSEFVYLHSYPSFTLYPRYNYSPSGAVGASYLMQPQGFSVYRVVLNSSPVPAMVRANTADLIFQVVPAKALIYVDSKLIGSARDFARQRDRYTIVDGTHELRIEYPGYEPFQTEMEIVPDRTLHLDIELRRTASSPR